MTRLTPRQLLLVLAICAALALVSLHSITMRPVIKDAAQNLQMGIDVARDGTMSLEEVAPFKPSMYREPLPVVVDAAAVALVDHLGGRSASNAYFSGPRARLVKLPNVLWVLLLWLAVFSAARCFTGSYLLAVIAGLLAVKPFLSGEDGVDGLYTELPAVALMTLSLNFLLATETRRAAGWAVATGLGFGLLTLTKAATLYVFAFLVLVLAVASAVGWLWADGRRRLAHLALLIVSFGIVVTPWMLRNLQLFGHARISSRGGLVLYTRGLMDQVTPLEYRGTFYVWARPSIQRYLGALLGFSQRDLEQGGRLQRLSEDARTSVYKHDVVAEAAGRPQDAISFHRQARAERVRLETSYDHEGRAHPEVDADESMQKDGMQLVKSHFGANLALAMPLMWRGAPVIFPALLIALVYALRAKRYALALFVLPAFATLVFYALATHFEPRPSLVAHSSAAVATIVLLQALWRWWYAGARQSAVARRAFAEYHQVREREVPGE